MHLVGFTIEIYYDERSYELWTNDQPDAQLRNIIRLLL